MHKFASAACVALFFISGSAIAETCPPASSISQTVNDDGYAYSAPGNWIGDNPRGNEDDIKTFKFTSAKVTDTAVICRYEADVLGGASLSIQASKTPTGGGWNSANECVASDVASCTFE